MGGLQLSSAGTERGRNEEKWKESWNRAADWLRPALSFIRNYCSCIGNPARNLAGDGLDRISKNSQIPDLLEPKSGTTLNKQTTLRMGCDCGFGQSLQTEIWRSGSPTPRKGKTEGQR